MLFDIFYRHTGVPNKLASKHILVLIVVLDFSIIRIQFEHLHIKAVMKNKYLKNVIGHLHAHTEHIMMLMWSIRHTADTHTLDTRSVR